MKQFCNGLVLVPKEEKRRSPPRDRDADRDRKRDASRPRDSSRGREDDRKSKDDREEDQICSSHVPRGALFHSPRISHRALNVLSESFDMCGLSATSGEEKHEEALLEFVKANNLSQRVEDALKSLSKTDREYIISFELKGNVSAPQTVDDFANHDN
eukprot:6125159-Amphidinium_carterae.1